MMPTLRVGSRGSDVTALQEALKAAGFDPGPVDGIFGPRTRSAVMRFQQSKGLPADGVVGQQTHAAFGGAPAAGEVAEDTSVEDLIREQYPTMVWALEHPELGPLLTQAAEGEWDLVKLQGELQATSWWQETSATAREMAILAETDPAEYQRRLDEATSRVEMMARDLGFTLDEEVMAELSKDVLTLQLTPEQLRAAVTARSDIDLGEIEAGEVGGLVQATKRDVEQVASNYLLDLTDADLTAWIDKIAAGTHTIESFQEYAEKLASAQMPFLEDFITRGLAPAEALMPYANRVASSLEINANQVDFRDPRFQQVLRVAESDGTSRLATLSELNRNVREVFANEWEQTTNAKVAATQMTTQIAEMFGRRA